MAYVDTVNTCISLWYVITVDTRLIWYWCCTIEYREQRKRLCWHCWYMHLSHLSRTFQIPDEPYWKHTLMWCCHCHCWHLAWLIWYWWLYYWRQRARKGLCWHCWYVHAIQGAILIVFLIAYVDTVDTCISLIWVEHFKYQMNPIETVADPGFSKWGGAVLSQMGGRTSCFQVKSAWNWKK